MVSIGIDEGKGTLTKGAKTLKKFTKLPSIEKKKLLVNHLGTKVDELFLEKEEGVEGMATDQ